MGQCSYGVAASAFNGYFLVHLLSSYVNDCCLYLIFVAVDGSICFVTLLVCKLRSLLKNIFKNIFYLTGYWIE